MSIQDINLLIFDLDGTLIDSRADIVNAVNAVLSELKLGEKSFDQIVSYVGYGGRSLLLKSIGEEHESLLSEAERLFTRFYREHFCDHSHLYPYVEHILEHFTAQCKMIVSNRIQGSVEKLLEIFGIRRHFKAVVGGDDPECLKPSPCPIQKALSFASCAPEQAIMIGDMDVDIYAGKSAGTATCAVTYGLGKKEDLLKSGPDYCIDSLNQLPQIVNPFFS